MASRSIAIEPRTVCIIKPSSLGDVVHALPVLSALRAMAVGAVRVGRQLGPPGARRGSSRPRRGHPVRPGRVGSGRGASARFGGSSAGSGARRFDLAIDLQGLFRSGLMAWATGARWRVGMAEAREGATRFYTHRVATGGVGVHAVDRLLRVAEAFGAELSRPRFVVAMSDDDRRWAEACWRACRGRGWC